MRFYTPFFYTPLLSVAVICLTACSSPTQTEQASTTPTNETVGTVPSELTVVAPWEITSTDPAKSGDAFLRLGIAETLVGADQDGTLIPALATDWKHDGTGKVWTFHLRDAAFHNGTPLKASDVVKSLTVALKKPTALENAGIDTITATDDKTVTITLKEPLFAFPAYLAHASTLILADASFDGDEVARVIGTGAYQADSIEPPQKITQTSYENYWGDKAHIKAITYLANSRSETRTLLANSPNHLVYTLDAASLARLKNDPNLQVVSASIPRTIALKMNAKHPLFDSAVVRRALSDAIDRTAIAAVLRIDEGGAEELLPAAFKDWHLGSQSNKPDYTAIKQTLLDNGFSEQNGKLYKDGKPFKFTLRTFADRPELPIVATALQDQWGKLGIDVDVSVGNFSEIPAGHHDGTLEMALYARNFGLIPNPIGIIAEDFKQGGSDWGVMNWQNDELTNALTELKSTSDETQAAALRHKIAQIIYDERPIIPIAYYQQNVATNKDLKGVAIDPFERSYGLNKLH